MMERVCGRIWCYLHKNVDLLLHGDDVVRGETDLEEVVHAANLHEREEPSREPANGAEALLELKPRGI